MARAKLWVPFSTGSVLSTIPGNTDARVTLTTLMQLSLGRELERFTLVRLIFNFVAIVDSGVGVFTIGCLMHNSGVAVGVIAPDAQAEAAWSYQEEVVVNTSPSVANTVRRDIGGQRKMPQGSDSELYFYIVSRGPTSGDFHLSGRALIMLP